MTEDEVVIVQRRTPNYGRSRGHATPCNSTKTNNVSTGMLYKRFRGCPRHCFAAFYDGNYPKNIPNMQSFPAAHIIGFSELWSTQDPSSKSIRRYGTEYSNSIILMLVTNNIYTLQFRC